MKVIKIVSFLVVCFLFSSLLFAQHVVRGKVLKQGVGGGYHLSGVPVTLSNESGSFRSAPSYTQSRGVFSIDNIAPGKYTLEIWAYGFNASPIKYTIVIEQNYRRKFFDIKPIIIPSE